jgi:hypothetical protein
LAGGDCGGKYDDDAGGAEGAAGGTDGSNDAWGAGTITAVDAYAASKSANEVGKSGTAAGGADA